jgi:hypothetical protein
VANLSERAGFMHRYGNTPQTHTIISSRSKIFAYNGNETTNTMEQVGVTSKFGVQQSRDVTPVSGIGYGDIIAELVPGRQGPIQLSVNRTAMYLLGIFQVFGYKGGIDGAVRALRHHRWPFDIRHEIIFSDRAQSPTPSAGQAVATTNFEKGKTGALKALITLFESCWMTSHNTDYSTDGAAVAEDVAISCTDMVDVNGANGAIRRPDGEDTAGLNGGGRAANVREQ